MKIKILGPGCNNCKVLYQLTEEVVKLEGMEAELEYITDMSIISRYIMSTPGIVVNDQVVHQGKPLPDKKRILELLHSVKN